MQQIMKEGTDLKKLVPEPEMLVLVCRELHQDEANMPVCLHLRENIGQKREPGRAFACWLSLYTVTDWQRRNEAMRQRDRAQWQRLRYWSGRKFFLCRNRLFCFRFCICQKPGMHLFYVGRVARQQVIVGHARVA